MMILHKRPFTDDDKIEYPGHFVFGIYIAYIVLCIAFIGFVGYMMYTTLA